jgi:serine/threonine-protein kinase
VRIGRYQVLGELGRGAMGIVYKAQDPAIGRVVAIKSIRLNEFTDPDERQRLRERLFREAQSAGILSHPNIVTIYDILEEDGLAYIFMEFVNGKALDDILREPELPSADRIIDLLAQTAGALDYAHKKGIIHRDIKPANIMVHDDHIAKVCDFGVAKIVSQQMTQAGLMMGTPSYMSPEQIQGQPIDGRSDQWALAVMTFDILTGQKPFTAEYVPTLLFKICRETPPEAVSLNPTLGEYVDPVLKKALSKDPAERFADCATFIGTLRKALAYCPDWAPLGRRAPGAESTTTGSGSSMRGPASATASGSQPVQFVEPPSVTTGGASRSGSLTAAPAPVPQVPSTPAAANVSSGGFVASAPSMAAPVTSAPVATPSVPTNISGPIPVRRDEQAPPPKKISMGPLVAVAALVMGVGGYLIYDKILKPAPEQEPAPQEEPKPPEPKAKEVAPKKKVEPPKQALPRPELPKQFPSGPPEGSKQPPPDAKPEKEYEIAFGTSPGGASVLIDNNPGLSCKTPCQLRLTKGRHGLVARLEGFEDTYRSFELPGSSEVVLTLPEIKGLLNVRATPPGGAIVIDGQASGKSAPAVIPLRVGTHQVRVMGPGQPCEQAVKIVRDGTHTINCEW